MENGEPVDLWCFLTHLCITHRVPTSIGESAKAYGLKVRCLYGEHVGEHIVNLGNIWEPIRNFKGTLWEHIRKQG